MLESAIDKGEDDASVMELLKQGADPNSFGERGPVLFSACVKGRTGVVNMLLDHGADVNVAGPDGLPGLFVIAATAAMKLKLPRRSKEADGIVECLEVLLKSGADPNLSAPGGFTCLHVAAEVGSESMAKALLTAGANVQARTADGQTPAEVAASWGHRNLAEMLLKRQALREGDEANPAPASVDELIAAVRAKEAAHRQAPSTQKKSKGQNPERSVVPEPEVPDESKSKTLQREGDVALVAGRADEALEKYHDALRHWTKSSRLWSDAAAAALRVGKFEEALKNARVARTVDSQSVKAWYREGQAAEELQQWEDAAAAYFEAYLLKPDGIQDATPKLDFGEMVKMAVARGKAAQLVASSAQPGDEAASA